MVYLEVVRWTTQERKNTRNGLEVESSVQLWYTLDKSGRSGEGDREYMLC